MTSKTQIHRVVLMVVDSEGSFDPQNLLDQSGCSGTVVSVDTEDVDWTDDHPLNKPDSWLAAFNDLFTTNDGTLSMVQQMIMRYLRNGNPENLNRACELLRTSGEVNVAFKFLKMLAWMDRPYLNVFVPLVAEIDFTDTQRKELLSLLSDSEQGIVHESVTKLKNVLSADLFPQKWGNVPPNCS